MKMNLAAKLGLVIILIEIAAVSALFFLLRQPGLPARMSVVLVFLLPITFGLHVLEEFIFPGGGPEWFKSNHPEYGQAYSDSFFFKINAIPLVLSLLVTLGTFDFAGGFNFWGMRAWLVFLSMQGFNVIFHIQGVFKLHKIQRSPGLITAVFLYIPLTIFSFVYLLKSGTVEIISAIVCMAFGSLLQPALDHIKKQNMKMEQPT